MKRFCKCGCGKEVNKNYIRGHQFIGVKKSDETKQKISNKLKGTRTGKDSHVCQNPKCWFKKVRLSVHHIDYDKENCRPSNLITLCISCNARANTNRIFWEKLYKYIMYKKYKYSYEYIPIKKAA